MPFITKGKTNWKLLLIFVILSIIIAFIIIGFQLDWDLGSQGRPVWTWREAREASFRATASDSVFLAIVCCDRDGILQDNIGMEVCNPPVSVNWPDHGDYYTMHIKIIKQCQFRKIGTGSGYGEFEYEISRCLQDGECRSANCTDDGCTYNF